MVVKQFQVGVQEELRFETARAGAGAGAGASSSSSSMANPAAAGAGGLELRVLSGTCEVFGRELMAGHAYQLRAGRSYGLFSWHGCVVQLDEAVCTGCYTSEETPMIQIANVHLSLEAMRRNEVHGPRVAVVGPAQCGKTTLANTLVAYAARSRSAGGGSKPVLVSLDVSKNELAVPGSVAAAVVDDERDLYGESGELEPFAKAPLVYFLGNAGVTANPERLRLLLQTLRVKIEGRMAMDDGVRRAGMIVDTFAWTGSSMTAAAGKALVDALATLRVDVVLVVGHDKLHNELKKTLGASQPNMKVVKVARSGGVAEADAAAVKRQAYERMQAYFYGTRSHLSPVRKELALGEDVKIYLLKAHVAADASIMPIGMEDMLEDNELPQMKVVDSTLKDSVLAVVHADSEENVLTSNVAGFVHVVEVDIAKNTLTCDIVCPVELPTSFLVHGDIKWFETD